MLFSVTFDKTILNRYVCPLSFDDGADSKINCIIDTACSTTLVPLMFAKLYGEPLGSGEIVFHAWEDCNV